MLSYLDVLEKVKSENWQTNSSQNIALIPARGGSKRIPKKNVKEFLGKPIISYVIETAKESGFFKEVYVLTDDDHIAQVARDFGANVPFKRSAKNADDSATLDDIMQEAKTELKKIGVEFENACCLLPCASLITKDLLLAGAYLLDHSNFDSIRPVIPFSYPVEKSLHFTSETEVNFAFDVKQKARTQDCKQYFHDSGMFYWFRKATGIKHINRGAFTISEIMAQDIDNETDWKLAELKYQLIK